MATALEVADVVLDTLMWAFSVLAITVFVLVAKGKIKLPKDPPPRRWKIALGVLAAVLLAGVLLPM